MKVYIDSSIILRLLFGEPQHLKEWPLIDKIFCSRLLQLEVCRVLDRTRLSGKVNDEQVVELYESAYKFIASFITIQFSENILQRAGEPMPTVLGSLDAIHLVTALELVKEEPDVILATHDIQLAMAARAMGLSVIGIT